MKRAVIRIASAPFKAAWTAFRKSQSPVEQDTKMVLYTTYRGFAVRLRPVMDENRPGWVGAWIPDRDECARIDAKVAEQEKEAALAPVPQPLPQQAAVQPAGGFNPAVCAGL